VLFSVVTQESAQMTSASLGGGFDLWLADASAQADAELTNTIATAQIKALVIGGSASDAAGIVNGVDALRAYITNNAEFSSASLGAPIAYKLAYLDNTQTKLAFTTEYQARECQAIQAELAQVTATLTDIVNHTSDVGGLAGAGEIFGSVRVHYPTTSTNGSCDQLAVLPVLSLLDIPETGPYWPGDMPSASAASVPVGSGQLACIDSKIWEKDTLANDDYGHQQMAVPIEMSGSQTFTIMHSNNSNRADVLVTISVE
jgi:hypothetical protein